MTHDFKGALESLENRYEADDEFVQVQAITGLENYNTICLAIKLADRLMGEPSEAMRMAAYDEWQNGKDAWSQLLAMRDQLLKECGE